MVRGSLRQPAMAETPPDNRFKRTADHAGLTPSQQKARREGNPVRIQANLHQTDNAAKGWVKGEETGNYTTVFELGKRASETFESIEASINSARRGAGHGPVHARGLCRRTQRCRQSGSA